mgnify:CR=1 FL=1
MKPTFAVALQYHPTDRAAAMRLVELIARFEYEANPLVLFLLCRRFDAEYIPDATVYQLAKKFAVDNYQTKTQARGWPDGCNAMAIDVLREINHRRTHDAQWTNVSGVLLMEPDCIPVSRFWLPTIQTRWEVAQAADEETARPWLMGAWRDGGGEHGHINGNMVVRPDFAEKVDLSRLPPGLAWDCAIVPQVREHWLPVPLIDNRWNERGLSSYEIMKKGAVLVHGVKDESVWNHVAQIA